MKKISSFLLSCSLLFPSVVQAAPATTVSEQMVEEIPSLQQLDTLQVNGQTLREGTDYTTSVQIMPNKQDAYVLLTFHNNYTGQVVKHYTIGSCSPFDDALSSFAANEIAYVYDMGLMNPYEDGYFHPADTVSRAMVTTILYRIGQAEELSTVSPFGDIDLAYPEYYTKPAIWAYRNGIVNGYMQADGTRLFNGPEAISREQIAALMYRFAGSPAVNQDSSGKFMDYFNVDEGFRPAMEWCIANGIFQGSQSEQGMILRPDDYCTREELAKILKNLVQI